MSSRAELGFEELDLIGGLSPIRPRPVAVFLPLAAVEAALASSPKQLGPDAGTYTTRASALIRRAARAPAPSEARAAGLTFRGGLTGYVLH